jgi:membrane peptidoglycan carboxypeptidase
MEANPSVHLYKNQRKRKRIVIKCIIAVVFFLFVTAFIWEVQTSQIQAQLLSYVSSFFSYWTEPGPSEDVRYPYSGPYDQRLGYAQLHDYKDSLIEKGYKVESQARFSPALMTATKHGLFTIYKEKTQAGLQIYDRDNNIISSSFYPQRIYQNLESIPDIVVQTLLFIENRELLDERYPYRNPAIEWDRFIKAIVDMAIHKVNPAHKAIGGSTMATQLEKYRHSPEGRTSEGSEKGRQMLSAALKAYLDGKDTLNARRQLVVDYINSVPLAAIGDYGEVNGLGDGLCAWYGADFDQINKDLSSISRVSSEDMPRVAQSYKQILSLFLAHRRPSYYLVDDQNALRTFTDKYIKLLNNNGIISNSLMNAAMVASLPLRNPTPQQKTKSQAVEQRMDRNIKLSNSAANAVRTHLSSVLGVPFLYSLDRLDLIVNSSIDNRIQQEVISVLRQLNDPEYAKSVGMVGARLLGERIEGVNYSFLLYERVNGANLMRIQADNLDKQLNINEGGKLELGSTSKLRTLITYLEIMAELHKRYIDSSPEEIRQALSEVPPSDRLSNWALSYLLSASDKSLRKMLESAMERRYSGNPGERFFTGGGSHTFVNFESSENGKMATVTEALQDSINLSFIRIMRDIVNYYTCQLPEDAEEALSNPDSPKCMEYLIKFADKEGMTYTKRFYAKYRNKTPEAIMSRLLSDINPTSAKLAVVFRSVKPKAAFKDFSVFMRANCQQELTDEEISDLHQRYSKEAFNLQDRGYIAGVHPLELWTVEYLLASLADNKTITLDDLKSDGTKERQEVYSWLFRSNSDHARIIRIRTVIEEEAFREIHKAWRRVGYPFDYLTPSYATAIGVSGDRPAALAELMGIIQNKGVRYPTVRIQSLQFAKGTPYETTMIIDKDAGEQVIAPEIADIAKRTLINVVENGTARRLHNSFIKSDGVEILVGGKTGTGDNRREVYGARGSIVESRVMSRTATFVFLIGDRFFGTITAYVAGNEAAQYKFTSSLPVQLVKVLSQKLMPLIDRKATLTKMYPMIMVKKASFVPIASNLPKMYPMTPVRTSTHTTTINTIAQTPSNNSSVNSPVTINLPVPTIAKNESKTDNTGAEKEYTVKLGSFNSKKNMDDFVSSLKAKGITPNVRSDPNGDGRTYHVYIGEFKNKDDATSYGNSLKEKNDKIVSDFLVREIPTDNP